MGEQRGNHIQLDIGGQEQERHAPVLQLSGDRPNHLTGDVYVKHRRVKGFRPGCRYVRTCETSF